MKELFRRLCAFVTAFSVCALFCVLAFAVPRFRARADGTAWAAIGAYVATQITYAALLDITSQYVTNNPEAAAIRGAEIAYAFMLINSANPAITVTSGNTKYYGGYTYYNGDPSRGVYFGSGYINNDARSSIISVHTNTAEFPDPPSAIVMRCQALASSSDSWSVYAGANRGWSGTYFIAINGWGSSGGLSVRSAETLINGDPVTSRDHSEALPLFIGSTSGNPTLSVSSCGASFYSGGIPDINVYLHSLNLTGDPETDFQIIHDDLEDDFPDDLPLYWVDPFEEPTEPTEETSDPTEETTESGTDTVQPFTLPPEWLETYPVPSIPDPSIPDPSDAVPPTINYEIQRNGLNFWSDLWTELIDKTGLGSYVVILLGLSILEWILWHAGNGGNGKGGEQ